MDMQLQDSLATADVLLCRHAPFVRVADSQGRLDELVDAAADDLADNLAELLKGSGREVVLLCSPQPRALASIRPLATRLELPVYADPDLAELRLGRDPRLSDARTAALWKAARTHPRDAALPGAETFAALADRALATLRGAVRSGAGMSEVPRPGTGRPESGRPGFGRPGSGRPGSGRLVVAMTHGGLIEAALMAVERATRVSPRARRIEHGAVALLRLDADAHWTIVRDHGVPAR